MRRGGAKGLRFYGLAVLLNVAGAVSLQGQDPRDACLAQAYKEFDAARRQQLLLCALNPSAGPPRGAWPVGVQLLAQTLIEDGKDSVAAAWLRWAIRLSPDLQPDTVQFLPRVVAAYRAARDFVNQTRSPGDSQVSATWLWPAQGSAEAVGRIQIAAQTAAPMRVDVKGVGPVGVGGVIPLAPGSYQITAAASGRDSVRVTREVVPGVTTVLDFHLPAPGVQVSQRQQAQQQRQQPPPPPPVQAQKKKFPVLWVVVGAVAVGGAVALLAGKGGGNPATTGGITIQFPNP